MSDAMSDATIRLYVRRRGHRVLCGAETETRTPAAADAVEEYAPTYGTLTRLGTPDGAPAGTRRFAVNLGNSEEGALMAAQHLAAMCGAELVVVEGGNMRRFTWEPEYKRTNA